MLQNAVAHLPGAADELGFPCLGQGVAVGVADLRAPGGVAHAVLARGDGLMFTGSQRQRDDRCRYSERAHKSG